MHCTSRGIRTPSALTRVIPAIIGRIGEPVNIGILAVRLVPLGPVVGNRSVFSVGIDPAYAPAFIVLIAGDIGAFDRLGVRGCGCQ